MLALIESPPRAITLRVPPSTRAVVSWNSGAREGTIAARIHRVDGRVSAPLPYAAWSARERRSFSPNADGVRVDVDVIRSDAPFDAITVETSADLAAVAVTVPDVVARMPFAPTQRTYRRPTCRRSTSRRSRNTMPRSPTRAAGAPPRRLRCSLGAHGITVSLGDAVRGVMDAADRGTGNWAFNVAFAGACGLRAAVAYLRGIEHALAFVRAGLPVVISIAWDRGELPGAAIEHSAGHLLVVRGADASEILVNDPAAGGVSARYPRAALDRVFRAHGGVAYVVAPADRTRELVALANGAPANAVPR